MSASFEDAALLQLCAAGSAVAVAQLLACGASASCCDADGFSALHSAAWADHAMVVRLLLEHGADVDAVDSGSSETSLHLAAKHGASQSCALLLGAGAQLQLEDGSGATALTEALRKHIFPIAPHEAKELYREGHHVKDSVLTRQSGHALRAESIGSRQ